MHRFFLVSVLAVSIFGSHRFTERQNLNIRIADQSGAPLACMLVIVRSIEGSGEVLRLLSDSSGSASLKLPPPGKYQVIATHPYGNWETVVKELVVDQEPIALDISVRALPTHGIGDVAIVSPEVSIKVVNSSGHVEPNAEIFVRDHEGVYGKWYRTDSNGMARASTFGDATEVLAFYGNHVAKIAISFPELREEQRNCMKQCAPDKSPALRQRELTLQLK